ncbi:hypothetical protein DIZ27_09030 [Streptomyces sp. NWU339]|uniref:hypothetical protein n=1 Tax=Streptomyces sp. NWU339 TaxID=2185284 RepID=UPI000D67D82C|nr:hypothetical protein [Streptomyces sp. NWU339]PWI10991.1 hypothetical protein DIZ27_09030 [Streptomyces sp. NWU339]
MGERRNDGAPSGRRRGHPEGAPQGHRPAGQDRPGSGPNGVRGAAGLEALLVRTLVRDGVDDGAEQRAVAAFREARETDAHRTGARTRRRDDWRPRERRLGRFSMKATLSVLIAGLSLGGVAVAGIGAAGSAVDGPGDDGSRDSRTTAPASTSAPPRDQSGGSSAGRPSGAASDSGPGSDPAVSERPAQARDTEAHCRAYERVKGRGKALDSVAWKRLVEAAGGAANVEAYCAGHLRSATAQAGPDGTGVPNGEAGVPNSEAGNSSSGSGPGSSGNSGSGPGNSGNDSGNSGNGVSGTQGNPAQSGGEKNP